MRIQLRRKPVRAFRPGWFSFAWGFALAGCSAVTGGSYARAADSPSADPYDLCVFINGASSPMESMPEFWTTVRRMKEKLEKSPGCRETLVFSASGDPGAPDLSTDGRDSRGVIEMAAPPAIGSAVLPAKHAVIAQAFRDRASALAARPNARTFVMFEGHGINTQSGGLVTLWREDLSTPHLRELIDLLPGQKFVFHDHCSAAAMLGDYLALNEEKDAVDACAVAVSSATEESSSDDGYRIAGKIHRGKGLARETDAVVSGKSFAVLPTRTSDAFLQKYIGEQEPGYAPSRKELSALFESLQKNYPSAATRARALERLVRKRFPSVSGPAHENDFTYAARLFADYQTIAASAQNQAKARGTQVTFAKRRDFLKSWNPTLYAKYSEDLAASEDLDSAPRREAETILSSVSCDLVGFAAFDHEECAHAGDGDGADGWLQESYRGIRRAEEAARELTAIHRIAEAGDSAALQRLESYLDCEGQIGD